jgi:hypothetical protein
VDQPQARDVVGVGLDLGQQFDEPHGVVTGSQSTDHGGAFFLRPRQHIQKLSGIVSLVRTAV